MLARRVLLAFLTIVQRPVAARLCFLMDKDGLTFWER